jgi:RES domain-containing protein
MFCFRLTRHPDLSGEGGRLNAARWHSGGQPILYTAESDALAILEVRVNLDLSFDLLPPEYWMVRIEVDDRWPVEDAALEARSPEAAAAFGDGWLTESSRGNRPGVLRVGSVVARFSRNLLLNPQAPGFASAVRVTDVVSFTFDPRLWRGV